MHHFRFEDLRIWQEAIEVGGVLTRISNDFESRKLFRFADQLRGASLSVSNNIAEGSGSTSNREFKQFLNFARRSVFENANMLLFFSKHGYLNEEDIHIPLERLHKLSASILSFSRSLKP